MQVLCYCCIYFENLRRNTSDFTAIIRTLPFSSFLTLSLVWSEVLYLVLHKIGRGLGEGSSPLLCRKYLWIANPVFARFMPTNGFVQPFVGIISFLSVKDVRRLPKRFEPPFGFPNNSIYLFIWFYYSMLFYKLQAFFIKRHWLVRHLLLNSF